MPSSPPIPSMQPLCHSLGAMDESVPQSAVSQPIRTEQVLKKRSGEFTHVFISKIKKNKYEHSLT